MEIGITKNEFQFDIDKLVTLGYRENNEKRNFLFISKCLGKHLIIKPEVCRLTGYALANYAFHKTKNINLIRDLIEYPSIHQKEICDNIYKNKIITNDKVLVLGFAETATGLGMAVASAIKNSYYVTTTREPITSIPSCLDFEETHSHATSHQCFLKNIKKLKNASHIILVDDEITTGFTMLHLIENLEKKYPSKNRKYTILSILDWRNQIQLGVFEQFKKDNQVNIEVKSLISGWIKSNDKRVFPETQTNELLYSTQNALNVFDRVVIPTTYGETSYLKDSGRFGVSEKNIEKLEKKCKKVYQKIKKSIDFDFKNKKVLVLGHGENIYIPSRIASYFPNADFKTTSRSPIYISDENNYPIKEKHKFQVEDVTYYFYDKSKIDDLYDLVIVFSETDLNVKFSNHQMSYKL